MVLPRTDGRGAHSSQKLTSTQLTLRVGEFSAITVGGFWVDKHTVLVVNGEHDTLVDPVDAVTRIEETLSQNGHSDYTLVVNPDTDHGLLQTETGLIAETRGRRDSVFAPGVMALQTEWVLARFDGQNITTMNAREVRSPVPVQISKHFEPGGCYELLPWYGRPTWQLSLVLLFMIVFGGAVE